MYIFGLANSVVDYCKFCISEMSFPCKLCSSVLYLMKYLDAMLGPSDLNACATIRGENGLIVNEKALEENGMNLQFFVDCSQPGDKIIFDTEVVKTQNTTVVSHPVVFDVANPDTSRVALQCPSSGTIFDVR